MYFSTFGAGIALRGFTARRIVPWQSRESGRDPAPGTWVILTHTACIAQMPAYFPVNIPTTPPSTTSISWTSSRQQLVDPSLSRVVYSIYISSHEHAHATLIRSTQSIFLARREHQPACLASVSKTETIFERATATEVAPKA